MSDSENILSTYVALRAKLARAVMGIVPPRDVEDIVQETYVRVCQVRNPAAIRKPRSFLYKTARNLALDHVKRAENRLSVSAEERPPGKEIGDGADSDSTLEQVTANEEFAQFCDAVRHLPVQCRRAFVLKKVYGFSQREIAVEMSLSESTVEKHIARGIRLCRSYLENAGDKNSLGSATIVGTTRRSDL